MKPDPLAENRGRRVADGWWWCDCPLKWPSNHRKCSRCCVYKPLKDSPLYEEKREFEGGHMPISRIQRAK